MQRTDAPFFLHLKRTQNSEERFPRKKVQREMRRVNFTLKKGEAWFWETSTQYSLKRLHHSRRTAVISTITNCYTKTYLGIKNPSGVGGLPISSRGISRPHSLIFHPEPPNQHESWPRDPTLWCPKQTQRCTYILSADAQAYLPVASWPGIFLSLLLLDHM